MLRIPTKRAPTHPGEMLAEEFLKPLGMTQRDLAIALHISPQRISAIVRGRRAITPNLALRLAKYFGMSADFWMILQLRWQLYQAYHLEKADLNAIQPRSATATGVK